MYNQNALLQYLYQMQAQQQPNMLASAEDGFDPDGPVARMLRAQRAAEAARAAQAQGAKGQPQPRPGMESADQTMQRRMREQGL